MRLFYTALAVMLLCAPASAHDWYPTSCCSSRDCAPLPVGAVAVTRNGYRVTLPNGSVVVIPQSETKPSPDENFHVCIYLDTGMARANCFWAPPLGS